MCSPNTLLWPNVTTCLVANENGQIQSFPRLLLNPRRTKDKPTSEEQEEWLVQYDPVLPDDAHRILSHNYHVCALSD